MTIRDIRVFREKLDKEIEALDERRERLFSPSTAPPANIVIFKPETKKEEEPKGPPLSLDLLKHLVSHHTSLEDLEQSTKPFRYLMANNGCFKVIDNPIGRFVVETKSVFGLEAIAPGVTLKYSKIPYEYFEQTLAFFKRVMKEYSNSEAMVQFYYDETNDKYIVYCPDQEVSGASVRFQRNEEMDSKYTLVLDIHSHNTMGAFWSATDDADEKETRLYGVIGKLNTEQPEWKFRAIVGGEEHPLTLGDIFEVPEGKEVDFPEEWMDKCKKYTSKYSGTSYTGYPGYSRYNYYNRYPDVSFSGIDGYYLGYDEYDVNYEMNRQHYGGVQRNTKSPGLGFLLDLDIMSKGDRIDMIKDMLANYLEEVAYAIYSEDKLDEIGEYCYAFEVEETGGDLPK